MLELFTEDVRRDPFTIYSRFRADSPVHHDPRAKLWMVFDYDGVKRVLGDPEVFSSRAAPDGGKPLDWLIFHDPPHHTKLRSIIMQAFTPRMVAGLESRISALSRGLLHHSLDGDVTDVVTDLAVPLPAMVIADMLGIPAADRGHYKRWSDAILMLSEYVGGGADAEEAGREYAHATGEMSRYLVDFIEERRKAPRDDLLSKLVSAQVDGEQLAYTEVLGFFQLLLLAGTETTTNLIGSTLLCLSENPDQLALLRKDPSLLPSAIEEVLRYRSPLQIVFRSTTREVSLHDRVIPAGQLVLAAIGSANRDERHFPDASRFDIRRDPNPHLAFGHGVHFCLGAALARLEARIVIGDFLQAVEEFRPVNEKWEPRKAFHVHGMASLPLQFRRRS
jgi:cytochrome P450